MLTKNELKYYSSLLEKKNRKKEGKFLVEGKKLLFEAIHSDFQQEIVFVTSEFLAENENVFNKFKYKIPRLETVKNFEMDKLCYTKTPQGIAGVFLQERKGTKVRINSEKIIALENISDPGNLGTIFRNCDWFGINEVILNSDCAEVFNPKTLRASMGAIFHIIIFEEGNFYNKISDLRKDGYKIVVADINGENIYKYDFPDKSIMIFCNEANGPTEKILKLSDTKITIPKKGNAESLNVASASAVILSEIMRR